MRPAEHSTRGIACAGNWILDVVHDITHWPAKSDLVCISGQTSGLGGGAANVSADLAALDGGYPVYAIGLVGDDQLGDTVRTKLAEAGLSGGRIATLSGGVTAHTHVMNVPGDSRTFFYHAGANDRFCAAYVDLHGLAAAGCRVFYLGYLNLLPSLDAIGADGRTGGVSPADAGERGRDGDLCRSRFDRYARVSRGGHGDPARRSTCCFSMRWKRHGPPSSASQVLQTRKG